MNENFEKTELIKMLYDKYYNISKKILNENNIKPNVKFDLGELMGELFYKIYLIRNLIFYKILNENENLEKLENYLNENLEKLENEKIENLENKLRIININIDYFMDKFFNLKKDK